jgi:hypothetical protein
MMKNSRTKWACNKLVAYDIWHQIQDSIQASINVTSSVHAPLWSKFGRYLSMLPQPEDFEDLDNENK